MELDTAKGVRDIDSQDMIYREEIVATLQKIFSRYGFLPLDTPIIERYDVLSAKFAAGEESDAMTEVYKLKDNGNRDLGLRFDLTVPLSRYIGMNARSLKMPFKRYQFGKVYRDAPIRAGRYREFTQCDVDIVGSKDVLSDVTCIKIAIDAYKELGLDVVIQVNNRKFLTSLITANGIEESKVESLMMSVDKLDKLGRSGVVKDASTKGFNEDFVNKIIDLLSMSGTNEEKLDLFSNMLPNDEGLLNLKDLISYFSDEQISFTPTLARGLGYYTGTVFEVYAKGNENIGAIGGGGRYDNLINGYLESAGINTDKKYPSVGISFGLDRMVDVLKKLGKLKTVKSRTKVLVVSMNTKKYSFEIVSKLRDNGINADVDLMNRNLKKNLSFANDYGIPFVIIVGENEESVGKVTLKDLSSGENRLLSLDEVIILLKK